MLKEVKWVDSRTYRSRSKEEPLQFYLDGLFNSTKLDLLLGYFSSAAISVLSLGFAKFLYSGGTVRMIINNVLSRQDIESINVAREDFFPEDFIDLKDIKALEKTLSEYDRHFFECLAWLIANNKIEIKIIKPSMGEGISHFKSGVFSDGLNEVGFKASCNFTAYGLLENLEELDCHLSWDDKTSMKWLTSQNSYFNEIFSGKATFVEYLKVEDVCIAIKQQFADKTIDELLIQEKDLLIKKASVLKHEVVNKYIKKLTLQIEEISNRPRFPYSSTPRGYQSDAYNNWCRNGFKGIFAMATGTGKTITSLNCLLNEYLLSPTKTYHAIILVPTITLVEQWEKEAQLFNFKEIIKVSSKFQWESELATTLSISKKIPTSFIVITTYASFIKERFNKYIREFPEDTVFIADEAHNIGSPSVLIRLASVSLQKRIALSATPKRIYDYEGSMAMEKFFDDTEPYTYSFTMERAIEEGILCKYYYHPHIVNLTADELKEYIDISKKLAKFYSQKTGALDINDIVQKLLLKRKRIIHKAVNKLAATTEILKERFERDGNLKYTFIYVPEGVTPELDEEVSSDEETIKIINQYTRAIGRIDDSIKVNQFISDMSDRDEILEQFKEGKIEVIASMKCLDEGVDIPRAEHAIFCSSTGNPRQFIQRRGRILRTHPQKDIAVIHDLIVIPDSLHSNMGSDTFRLERSLVQKELERVMYFASLAINPFETERIFEQVCNHYNLNIYTIHNKLK